MKKKRKPSWTKEVFGGYHLSDDELAALSGDSLSFKDPSELRQGGRRDIGAAERPEAFLNKKSQARLPHEIALEWARDIKKAKAPRPSKYKQFIHEIGHLPVELKNVPEKILADIYYLAVLKRLGPTELSSHDIDPEIVKNFFNWYFPSSGLIKIGPIVPLRKYRKRNSGEYFHAQAILNALKAGGYGQEDLVGLVRWCSDETYDDVATAERMAARINEKGVKDQILFLLEGWGREEAILRISLLAENGNGDDA